MTITVTTVANNQSFGGWLATTNRLANIASQNTVTIDYTSGGSLSTGNGYVNGYFGANNIYVAAGLSGGNISSNGVLNIVSNTAFKYSSSNLVVLTANSTESVLAINVNTFNITANTISFTGNTNFINTISIGNSTVNSVINSTSLASINSTSITTNSITANAIIANGSLGTANQVLSSNGTGIYWADVAAGATFVRQLFTANSTVNTSFTITNGYTVNAIDIYKNGVKLIVGTEVTANNGTSITLAVPATIGTIIDVVGLLSAAIYSLNINTVSQGFAFSWTNNHVFNSNVTFNNAIIANGGIGTANQVLSSNGTGVYWGDVAAGATFVRQTFTANSTVNTSFTITNGYTVNAIDVYENGVKLINGIDVTANNGTTITLANSALVGTTVDVVGLLSASMYSLNINTVSQGFSFSWTNNHVFNSNVDFYSALTANSITVGNSTVNSVINSTSLTANSIIANALTANTISVGNSTVNSVINSTSLTASSIIANGSITVGNSTVNSVINSTSLSTAVIDLNTGTAIASAATINLNTTTGNRVHITGTTTITAVTLTRGPRTVIFDGILTLTHHATNNNLPGAANITTVAGDRAIYESDGTTVFCVSYTKASFIASDPKFLIQLYA